ncbi:uncharacterized protein VTP21DRAFT_11246 [Calcarisporiella thermophila]|uniref:uncharacterized protein n=1 Tax=Calcarisporiella thermophila TaxID=911321 RepID=UPI003743CF23
MPQLIPVVAQWSPAFAAYFAYLSMNAGTKRFTSKQLLLTNSDKQIQPSDFELQRYSEMDRAVRAHANFSEYVPLGLIFVSVAELNGCPRRILHYFLGTLFVSRVLHANLGILSKENAGGFGRCAGFFGTLGVMCLSAAYSAWSVCTGQHLNL